MPKEVPLLIQEIKNIFDRRSDELSCHVFSICAEIYCGDFKEKNVILPNRILLARLMDFFQRYPQVIPKGTVVKFSYGSQYYGIFYGIVKGIGYKDHYYDETFKRIRKTKEVIYPEISKKRMSEMVYKMRLMDDAKRVDGRPPFTIDDEYASIMLPRIFVSIAYTRLRIQIDKLNENKEIPKDLTNLIANRFELLRHKDLNDDIYDDEYLTIAELARLINEIFKSSAVHDLDKNIAQYDKILEKLNSKPFQQKYSTSILNKRFEFFKKSHTKPFFENHFDFFQELRYDSILLKKLKKEFGQPALERLFQGPVIHDKKEFGNKSVSLNKIAKQIYELKKKGGQNKKTAVLCDIYFRFKNLDFSVESVNDFRKHFIQMLPHLDTFDSNRGFYFASVKQLFSNPGYSKTMSYTGMLVRDLTNVIESEMLEIDRKKKETTYYPAFPAKKKL